MSTNNLNQKITTKLLQLCIINNEEASLEILMNKRQTIIQNHIKTVYPIKETEVGGKQKYYTKLNPKNRNNNGQIRTSTREELEDKIVASVPLMYSSDGLQ